MGFLRKRDTGAVTDWLGADTLEYQTLKAMRFVTNVTAAVPTNILGIPSGETGGAILAGQPVWEDIAEQDAGFPDPAGGRVIVVYLGPAATAGTENSSETVNTPVAGNLTDVEYVTNSPGITGQATNYRTVTLNQITLAGTSTVTRTVTALASVSYNSAAINATAGAPSPLTISTAAFAQGAGFQVVSSPAGTGVADPGGILYAVYTRA